MIKCISISAEALTITEMPTDAEIADAVNILYQIRKGYRKNDRAVVSEAEVVLKRAGKEAVREFVMADRMEGLTDPKFWAKSEEEVKLYHVMQFRFS
jgi:hypothetical protein